MPTSRRDAVLGQEQTLIKAMLRRPQRGGRRGRLQRFHLPTIAARRRRDKRLELRVSEEDLCWLRRGAEAAGQRLSSWVRDAAVACCKAAEEATDAMRQRRAEDVRARLGVHLGRSTVLEVSDAWHGWLDVPNAVLAMSTGSTDEERTAALAATLAAAPRVVFRAKASPFFEELSRMPSPTPSGLLHGVISPEAAKDSAPGRDWCSRVYHGDEVLQLIGLDVLAMADEAVRVTKNYHDVFFAGLMPLSGRGDGGGGGDGEAAAGDQGGADALVLELVFDS